MVGRIKAGEGTLIGNAGEYFVVAELLKRGVIAALAPRNTPAFDILATNPKESIQKTIQIRVKTKSQEYDAWRWNAKKDDTIFPYLSQEHDFTVLVNLTRETKDMDYFILKTWDLNSWLVSDWENWIATPGKMGQAHSTENRIRAFYYRQYKDKLAPFRNNWGILWG